LAAQSSPFVFVVVSDPQIGMKETSADRDLFARTAAALNALRGTSRPAFVIIAGDMINDPKIEAQVAAYDEVRKTINYPVYTVPGNHDAVPSAPARFSFEQQGCLFVGLDSNLWNAADPAPAKEQFDWLEAQLRDRNRYRHVFVIQHFPVYLHDPQEKDDYYNTAMRWRPRLLELFESARVTAVVSGHLHRYTTLWHRGMALLVTPSSLNNFDGTPPGVWLFEVNSAGFAETYRSLPAKP
jgi:3',5'-cyclic AMP phosphodiesterase CpdA